jgi:hypothetical protein
MSLWDYVFSAIMRSTSFGSESRLIVIEKSGPEEGPRGRTEGKREGTR